ncbi:P-loop containing nucleoside triphosphate hydrolase protein [Melanogaster broomeanus]|nr:P-loop containing nucleoside triphosphate hydrolase protein [Melanogaster broomeanus]
MAVPLIVVLAKGKAPAAELAGVVSSSSSLVPTTKRRKTQDIRRITPRTFTGDFALTNLTFSYPSRPTVPVLREVDLYLPARETTFIVGPSGCGKSTLGSILLGYYTPELGKGEVLLDEQDVRYLDSRWLRRHVAGVTQGSAGWQASRGRDERRGGGGMSGGDVGGVGVGLEATYDMVLSGSGENGKEEGGIVLSGGMRQRLALARARIRNPGVLILDESTSALDPTTRLLTIAAIRAWRTRAQKTTIVITHDLTSINGDDFVYVVREGRVVEQGFRADLEKAGGERQERNDRHFGVAPNLGSVRPVTMALGGWMFDVVAELTKTANDNNELPAPPTSTPTIAMNKVVETEGGAAGRRRRPSSMSIVIPPSPAFPPRAYDGRQLSLQFTPVSPSSNPPFPTATSTQPMIEDDSDFEGDKSNLQRSGEPAAGKRAKRARKAHQVVQVTPASKPMSSNTKSKGKAVQTPDATDLHPPTPGLFATLRLIYPTIPSKHLMFLGLFASLLSGAMTPIFSFLLSKLMFEISADPANASIINSYGGLVLGIAAVDGLLLGSKYFLMETSAIRWATKLRDSAYSRILSLKTSPGSTLPRSPAALAQVLVKGADDVRTLVAVVIRQFVVVLAMMGLGLIWAMVWGWQLTLVGVAIGPVFVAVMGIQAGLVAKYEVRNKRAREEVARVYYESILNVRGIRAMSLEPALQSQFDKAASLCLSSGIRGAFVEGCTYGIASALIYLAEALLFYVGAVLIARGTYSYLQMVQVLNLVVFTVTIGSQLMAFTQKIAKSVQATADLFKLVTLRTDRTSEGQGILRPPIEGALVLKNVSFAYPTNPDTPVLDNLSMKVAEEQCVALVGASGCGKSTVATLLQRLYEPTSGTISNSNLFDGSIRENIAYGRSQAMNDDDVVRVARAANVHDFVVSLPQGRSDSRSRVHSHDPSKILILDECTSALDGVNQSAVMETIRDIKVGRITVMVTHKVAEQGTYEELVERKGLFAMLASGGEWVGE